MDECDIAQRNSETYLAAVLSSSGSTAGRVSLFICLDCGSTIPEKRRIAVPGCTLCIQCQEETERENRNP